MGRDRVAEVVERLKDWAIRAGAGLSADDVIALANLLWREFLEPARLEAERAKEALGAARADHAKLLDRSLSTRQDLQGMEIAAAVVAADLRALSERFTSGEDLGSIFDGTDLFAKVEGRWPVTYRRYSKLLPALPRVLEVMRLVRSIVANVSAADPEERGRVLAVQSLELSGRLRGIYRSGGQFRADLAALEEVMAENEAMSEDEASLDGSEALEKALESAGAVLDSAKRAYAQVWDRYWLAKAEEEELASDRKERGGADEDTM